MVIHQPILSQFEAHYVWLCVWKYICVCMNALEIQSIAFILRKQS